MDSSRPARVCVRACVDYAKRKQKASPWLSLHPSVHPFVLPSSSKLQKKEIVV